MSYSKVIFNAKQLNNNLQKLGTNNVCAMVKANAYGVGLKNVVLSLKKKVNFFGVSSLDEALEVRKLDKETPVLIVGYCEDFLKAINNNISITVENFLQIILLEKISKKINKKIKIHIKINTGMNRYGIKNLNNFKKILKTIKKNNKKIIFEGIFTHFYFLNNKKASVIQLKKFNNFINLIPKKFNPIKHIGGGDCVKVFDKKLLENFMIRVGYRLYENVIKIESTILKITKLLPYETLGYDAKFKAKKITKIALVPMGYADGINRKLSGKIFVKINGKYCKVIGNICMDVFFVDVTNVNCSQGDKVLVFTNAKKWAKIIGTIPYEVLTSLNFARLAKIGF